MRVALVHDWLTGLRGGERVLHEHARMFPDAELFTLVHVPGSTTPEIEALFQDRFVTNWVFDVEIIARLIRARRRSHGVDVAESIYEYPLEEWRDVAGSKLRSSDFARAVFEILRIWRTYLRGT